MYLAARRSATCCSPAYGLDIVRLMELDLDAIETDLADVEIALARLESGEYWTCEVTGDPLDDALLERRPTARRAVQPNA